MRIVFFMRNVGYIRNFEWVLRELARRNHQVRVIFDTRKSTSTEEPAQAHLEVLRRECAGLEFEELIARPKWESLHGVAVWYVRLFQDYLRYLEPAYANAPKLRARFSESMNPRLRAWLDRLGASAAGRRRLKAVLERLDRLIPPPPHIVEFLSQSKPDLLLVTPLVGMGSSQADYIKAARRLGIRTCLPVTSWDNLTNKGMINIKPDRVLVWNEAQKREAVEMHGVPERDVAVVGAHSYDHWFTWQPSMPREAFLEKVGLSPDRPYILFLGSSPFIAPNEPPIVLRWAEALRGSGDPLLRSTGILIRPHPQNAKEWARTDVSHLDNVAVYPRRGANPVGRDAKSEYFDSMYHCRLVVGANTSAMIEASILGKPVHTVLFEELTGTQEGTLHFHHLTAEETGAVHVWRNLDEHVRGLPAALEGAASEAARSRAFVQSFVRPPQLAKLPTEICVDVIEEQLARKAPEPMRDTLAVRVQRLAAAPLLAFCVPTFRASQLTGIRSPRRNKAARRDVKISNRRKPVL